MASYQALDSYRSIEVNTGGPPMDVEVVTVQTIPTGITYTHAVPLSNWQADQAVYIFTTTSDWMEGLVANHHVVGGTPSQDFDQNNLLANYVDFIVEYVQPNSLLGPLHGTVSAPIIACVFAAEFGDSTAQAGVFTDPIVAIDAEYQRLAALSSG